MMLTFSAIPQLPASFRRCFPPGRRAYFLLLCQRKVAKEKATPGSASGYARSLQLLGRPGTPRVLLRDATHRSGRGSHELAYGSNNANRQPPANLRCSAPPKGTPKASRHYHPSKNSDCCGALAKKAKNQAAHCQSPVGVNSPRGRCRATQVLAEKGRGLSEARRAEFRSALSDAQHREEVLLGCPRPDRVAQGIGRSPASTSGRLLFAYFFLAKQEKVMSRIRRENQRQARSKILPPASSQKV